MPIERDAKGRILPGSGGRTAGSRNRLQHDFVEKLQADFAEHGEGVIRIVRVEKPVEYLKVVAAILPKEFHVKDATLDELTDEQILDALETIRALRAGPAGGSARKAAAGPDDPTTSRH
jgi:hypothetical protein